MATGSTKKGKLQKRAESMNNTNPQDQKYPYKPCKLVDYGGDLSRYWYIYYKIYNVDTKKLQRKIYSEGINEHHDKTKRRLVAKEAIKVLNKALEEGATTSNKNIKTFDEEKQNEENIVKKGKLLVEAVTLLNAIDFATKILFVTYSKHSKRSFISMKNHLTNFLKQRGDEHILLTSFESSDAFEFSDYLLTEAEWKEPKTKKIVQGLGKKTHNNYKNNLARIYTFYKERYPKIITYNPLEFIKNKRTKTNQHKPYTQEQLDKLQKAMRGRGEHQLLLFVQFLYYAFLRPNTELRLLKIGDIKEKTIFIPPHIAKNETGDHVKIPAQLEKIIQENKIREYPDSYYLFSIEGKPGLQPPHEKYFYNHHKVILKDLRFEEGYDLYGYKHTGNIALYRATKDIKLIMRQNRHSTIEMTDKYLQELGVYAEDEDLERFPEFGKFQNKIA